MAVSQAIAQRNAKNAPRRLLKGVSVLSDLADGGAVYGYPGDWPGAIYYVNNITGNSGFDGLSWDTPFDEVNTAITASEAYRAARFSANNTVRNIIYVQGTGTAYANLTALPNYCDIIGVGADPRGDGTGIVVIKGAEADAAVGTAVIGLYMTNIQFAVSGGTSYNALDIAVMIQSTIENCTFTGSTANTANSNAAIRSTSHFAGNTIRNCVIGTTNGSNAFNIGFDHSGGVGNNNLFEDNVILGVVHGVKVDAGINDNGTVWKNNIIHGPLGNTEPTTAGMQMGAHSHAVANWIAGADAITEASASQTIYNVVNYGGDGAYEDPLST